MCSRAACASPANACGYGQLIEAETGNHVWAERYDRPVADIFEVQDEITEKVVAAIESQVYAAEKLRVGKRPTESLDAWGCVVRAMPWVWTWSSHDNEFRSSCSNGPRARPRLCAANSLLAWTYAARAHLGRKTPQKSCAPRLLSRQAIEQDGRIRGLISSRGMSTWFRAVRASHRRVKPGPRAQSELRLRPHDPGLGLRLWRRLEKAVEHLAIAARLSPRDHLQAANLSTSGLCHFLARRLDKAVLRTARRSTPAVFGTAWRTLAASAGTRRRCRSCRPGLDGVQAAATQSLRRLGREVSSDRASRRSGDVHRRASQGRARVGGFFRASGQLRLPESRKESRLCACERGLDRTHRLPGQILGEIPDQLRFDCLVEMPAHFTEGPRIGDDEQIADLAVEHLAIEEAGDRQPQNCPPRPGWLSGFADPVSWRPPDPRLRTSISAASVSTSSMRGSAPCFGTCGTSFRRRLPRSYRWEGS